MVNGLNDYAAGATSCHLQDKTKTVRGLVNDKINSDVTGFCLRFC